MRCVTSSFSALTASAVLLLGCDNGRSLEPSSGPDGADALARRPSGFATVSALPELRGGHGEAYAVDQAGSVIAGFSWDRSDRMIPVTWTLQDGAWRLTALPYPASATGATARGVNDQGDVAGYDHPPTTRHALLWPSTGGLEVLGCDAFGEVHGISAAGRTVVGRGGAGGSPATAAVWQPGSCREDLPTLVTGGNATAHAVNGDATIVGGDAEDADGSLVPVRWTRLDGGWAIQQLDGRPGSVLGANSAGDLVGYVELPCSPTPCNGPSLGMVWYVDGSSRELGTLGGASTTPRGINAAREVVGVSGLANGVGAPFFWSETLGMRQLPARSSGGAFAVSGERPDGTRLVVGAGGRPFAALSWVVRIP